MAAKPLYRYTTAVGNEYAMLHIDGEFSEIPRSRYFEMRFDTAFDDLPTRAEFMATLGTKPIGEESCPPPGNDPAPQEDQMTIEALYRFQNREGADRAMLLDDGKLYELSRADYEEAAHAPEYYDLPAKEEYERARLAEEQGPSNE